MVNLRSLRGMRRVLKQTVDNDATRTTSSDASGTYVSSAYADVTFVKSS